MGVEFHDDEPEIPLQVEFSGQGPGSTVRTAIGLADEGPSDLVELAEPPWWWWLFVRPFVLPQYKTQMSLLPAENAFAILALAGVPAQYRLALAVQWDFVRERGPLYDELKETFELIGFEGDDFETVLNEMELRSAYRIWKFTLDQRTTLTRIVYSSAAQNLHFCARARGTWRLQKPCSKTLIYPFPRQNLQLFVIDKGTREARTWRASRNSRTHTERAR